MYLKTVLMQMWR